MPDNDADLDPITGFLDRVRCLQTATWMVAEAERKGLALAVLWIDLDRFRQINASFGHAAGDEVIARVAERIRGVAHKDRHTLARMGSDEFVILLAGPGTRTEQLMVSQSRMMGATQGVAEMALAIAAGPVQTRHRHAAAVAIPAGLAIGCAAVGVVLRVCTWLRPDDFVVLLVMMVAGPVFASVFAAAVWRYLLRWPLRVGAAHVLRLVTAAGVVSLVVLAPLWWGVWRAAAGLDQALSVATLLFGALPLAWAIGPALALWLGRRAPG